VRVGIEATSMLGPLTGVGHTTAALVRALVETDPEVELVLVPLSGRRGHRLGLSVPEHPRITPLRVRVPSRPLAAVWAKGSWPPIELFSGQVDVFHGPNFMLPPLLKAAGVMTVHDIAFVRLPGSASAAIRAYADSLPMWTARAHRILVPSGFTADELSAFLPATAGRIRVVPPGVRASFAEPGGELAPPRREALGIRSPYVAYLGTLESRKNIDKLLEAFALVAVKRPDAQLVLVGGPGTGWDDIQRDHADLLGSGSVLVAGYLPDEEAAAVVRGASLFVYPSLYEGFGMPPVEAMAAGTPVVASDIPVLREVLGSHATLVPPHDADAWAEAIVAALDGPPPAEALDRARTHASGFTWTATASGVLAAYREAVSG